MAIAIAINTLTSVESQGSFWDYLEEHTGLIAIIAVIATIIIFIIERVLEWRSRKKENNERITRSCNAILEEIKDHKDTFTNPNYQNEYVIREPDIRYSTRILNSDAFDSVLHSGLFTRFETETQNSLSNLYLRIKLKNESLRYLNRFHDTFFLYDHSPKRQERWQLEVLHYEEILTIYDREISVFLDGVETLIRTKELP